MDAVIHGHQRLTFEQHRAERVVSQRDLLVHHPQRTGAKKKPKPVGELREQWVVDITTLCLVSFHETILPYLSLYTSDANKKRNTTPGDRKGRLKFIQDTTRWAIGVLETAFGSQTNYSVTSLADFTTQVAADIAPFMMEQFVGEATSHLGGRWRWADLAQYMDDNEKRTAIEMGVAAITFGAALYQDQTARDIRKGSPISQPRWGDMDSDDED